jgi:predicted RND superfamily exporter protein
MITAGLMGILIRSNLYYFGFSIGLVSVDDTIHFLAQYRQELTNNNWKIKNLSCHP